MIKPNLTISAPASSRSGYGDHAIYVKMDRKYHNLRKLENII